MSRSRTRARNRRAQREGLLAEFESKRENPEAFSAMLRLLAESDIHVWALARLVSKPLDDAESAMISQVVAPHLSGRTPGSVHRRRKFAE
jgi:hypothetical protein